MQTITFKEWCQQNGITQVSGVFLSKERKYPTILCIDGAGEKHPLVLSLNAGERWPAGSSAFEFAKEAFVCTYERESDGATISKLATNAAENASVDELFA